MYLYENSIIDDINYLFTNSKVKAVIADSLDEALRRSASENEDNVTLPFIVLTGGDWRIDDYNFYSLMHGIEFKQINDDSDNAILSKQINAVPFTPTYDMYIAASSSRECDMLTREIIFHYLQNPTLTVKIPYGINDIHTFNIQFESNVRKTTRQSGLVYRVLSFTLQGAYLWHNNTFDVVNKLNVESVKEKYDENN